MGAAQMDFGDPYFRACRAAVYCADSQKANGSIKKARVVEDEELSTIEAMRSVLLRKLLWEFL